MTSKRSYLMKTMVNQPERSLKSKITHLDMASNFAIVLAARKGLPTKIFYDFAGAIKTSEKNLAALVKPILTDDQ